MKGSDDCLYIIQGIYLADEYIHHAEFAHRDRSRVIRQKFMSYTRIVLLNGNTATHTKAPVPMTTRFSELLEKTGKPAWLPNLYF